MFTNIFYEREKNVVHIWDDVEGYLKIKHRRYAYIKTDEDSKIKDIYGNNVKRVISWKENDDVYESDVRVETRHLVDKYWNADEGDLPENRVLVFDIEIDVTLSFPNIKTANNAVTSIATYDYKTDEWKCLILDLENKITESKNDNVHIIPLQSESELLLTFIELINHYDPTILTGWNIDGFDIPYLINRMNKVLGDVYTNRLSPIDKIIWDDYKGKYEIAGRSCLDYLELYKKFTFSEERNYRLDTISKKELGYGKIEYEGTLNTLFNTDLQKYIDYNINDVKIVKELNDKKKLIDSVVTICVIGKTKYEDIYMSSRYIDGAILSYLKSQNLVAINKDPNAERTTFEGAYVKEPKPGMYPFIYDLDLTSLYPSIIMSLNISPETKKFKVLNWNERLQDTDEVELYSFVKDSTIKMNYKTLKEFLVQYKLYISSNGVIYKSKELQYGVIPSILDKWFAKRVEYKNKMKEYGKSGDKDKYEFYDNLQYAQKVLLNSVYGVLGLSSFRWYDLDNAASVTSTGQVIIKNAERSANDYYTSFTSVKKDYVTYIDTDSVTRDSLILLNDNTKIKIEDLFNNECKKEDSTYIEDISNRKFIFPNDLQIPYYNNNEVKFGKVEYIEKHNVKKKIFNIKTKLGNSVKITKDHSLMVLDSDNNLVEKKPIDLKVGDKIISMKN